MVKNQDSKVKLNSSEQCHTALALVRCPLASQIFQGRKEILNKMQEYFSQEPKKRRIFVLYGLGGSGKTQIAVKFLEETSDEVSKQFFVNASSSEALSNSFMNIAISQRFGRTPEAGIQWLISEHKEWTLLFDNADDPKLKLSPFFPRCTHGKIIITSRNPQLAVYGPASHSQVGDLNEENAALLLLARALQEHTDQNHKLAMVIVQELSCLPLAIVQAGAYIAKFKCLKNYLSIYRQNKKELLLQHPDQTVDEYEWTVYTTWQISFEKLSPVAARFLQLCALLHHSNIPESIFVKATEWIVNNEGNKTGSMQATREFLQNFISSSGIWHEQHFRNTVAEIAEYSLLEIDERSKTLSMHPLVHLWCSDTQSNQATMRECMTNILGMAIDLDPDAYLERIKMISHVKMLIPDFTVVNSQFWHQYARMYYDGGKFEQAKGLYEMDLERQRELFGNDHPNTLFAMANLASTYWHLGRYQEAEGLDLSVLQGRQKLFGDDHPETLFAMANLATTYWHLGQYQEAEGLNLSVLQGCQKLLGDDHPYTLFAMANLATTYRQLGRYQESEGLDLSVLQGRQKLFGDDHPYTLFAMANLATTYRQLGRYQEAEGLNLSVLQGRQKLLGDDHPDTLVAMANLATTYRPLGRYQEAEGLDLSVLQGRQKLLGDDHHYTLFAMANLATTYRQLGQYQEAEGLDLSVLQGRQKLLGDDHPETLRAMANLAMTLGNTGRHQAAENLQLQVVAKRREVLGADHPDTLRATKDLTTTRDALGKAKDTEFKHTSVKGLSKLFSRFQFPASKKRGEIIDLLE
ncbi:P-loop containing nucleoside triphosphate hydrolase protein [Roridomyces roridus]|uniref:P-loop containing nucleoside triphosphate hydrolase protein n=1 Tax=Roridomyces roridus TaxID=1738132 RepID=A0AAD7FPR9_9AGAR|nr:P-loop containing nucleoside triphosphate hydrolase protein [Roridomyces roridus]